MLQTTKVRALVTVLAVLVLVGSSAMGCGLVSDQTKQGAKNKVESKTQQVKKKAEAKGQQAKQGTKKKVEAKKHQAKKKAKRY
jgi:hypothetical protein